MENNTNSQTFHQMGQAINDFVKQATGRDNLQNIDMDHITVAQNHFYQDVDVSGRVVSFHAGAAGLPLEKCVVQIEPVQDLHGYDHPWPGGGNGNMMPELMYKSTLTILFIGNDSDSYSIPLNAGTYTITIDTSITENKALYCRGENATDQIQIGVNIKDGIRSYTFTINANDKYRFWLYQSGGIDETKINKFWLNAGDSASEFIPYSNICPITGWTEAQVFVSPTTDAADGQTYSITFSSEAGTVYGGTLDVVSGELVVDRAYELLNNPEKWVAATTAGTLDFRYQTNATDRKIYNNSYSGVICSYAPVNGSNPENTARWSGSTSYVFGFRGFGLNLDQIKADAELGKISIVYELAEPITYQLTPTEITTLLGVNNIWADAGDIEVKFKDLKELY